MKAIFFFQFENLKNLHFIHFFSQIVKLEGKTKRYRSWKHEEVLGKA